VTHPESERESGPHEADDSVSDTPLTFSYEKLTLSVAFTEVQVRVIFRGEGDSRDPSAFITHVAAELMPKLDGRKVRFDFRPLQFMNSATVGAILALLRRFDAARIHTILDYDTKVAWQRTNFNCMKAITKTFHYVALGAR
jgi:hypothetical protein